MSSLVEYPTEPPYEGNIPITQEVETDHSSEVRRAATGLILKLVIANPAACIGSLAGFLEAYHSPVDRPTNVLVGLALGTFSAALIKSGSEDFRVIIEGGVFPETLDQTVEL